MSNVNARDVLRLEFDPEVATAGQVVTVTAIPPSPGKYHFKWKVSHGAIQEGAAASTQVIHVSTRDMEAGDSCEVTATAYEVLGDEKEKDGTPSGKSLGRRFENSDRFTLVAPSQPAAAFARVGGTDKQVGVTLRRTLTRVTPDVALWVILRRSAQQLSFKNYTKFLSLVLCDTPTGSSAGYDPLSKEKFADLSELRFLPYNDADAYRVLKVATEAFVMVNCGVKAACGGWGTSPGDRVYGPATCFDQDDEEAVGNRLEQDLTAGDLEVLYGDYLEAVNGSTDLEIPYLALIRSKLADLFPPGSSQGKENCLTVVRNKLRFPCLTELIWSYWHEEGMLVQTMNALTRRFQNIRAPNGRDPLASIEIDPLRSLNNLLWGYIQDEQHRLSLERRVYEYDHHYGFMLHGKAVPALRPADSRSRFLEAFHNLLYLCSVFFREDDDTTVIADGFPVLNALKDVHLLLSEGAHNQFGDLPTTSRIEMLMQQWILARPEFREYLPTRIMVDYPEKWMDRVEAMKTLQTWTDVSVLHFRNLAFFGEQLLLSIRYAAWSTIDEAVHAVNWLRFWRSEIQGYIHAYRAATGVDLTAEVTDAQGARARFLPPAVHLRNRLAEQQRSRLGGELALESGAAGGSLGPGGYGQPVTIPAGPTVGARRRLPPGPRRSP